MHKTGNYQQMGCIAALPILSENKGITGIAGSKGLESLLNFILVPSTYLKPILQNTG
jgi:hypothetical protein